MAKAKKVRIGIIGCGGVGRGRVKNLIDSSPDVEIVAGVDPVPENINIYEQIVGKPMVAYTGKNDYKKMIKEQELDAVGIFSPHDVHYAQAKYALEQNLHVMIEKPMVCGAPNAIETAKMAAERGLIYMITYQRHFMPQFITARDLILKGAIGEVKNFYVYMAQDYGPARGKSWRADPKQSRGGEVNDSGSHYQDILLWMTGLLPVSVEGYIDSYYQELTTKIEMNGMFRVELSNGALGRLIIIGDYIGGFSDDVRVKGDKGVLKINGMTGEVQMMLNGAKKPKNVTPKKPKSYPNDPSDNFVKLVQGKTKENRVPAIFGAKVALLTDMLLGAAKTGKKVTATQVLKGTPYSVKDLK